MEFQSVDWKKGIMSGVIAGAVWGWLAIAINMVSRAFTFEQTLLQHLITFTAGGIIFGVIASGVLILTHCWMPSRNTFMEAVFISASLWGILEVGGIILHFIEPERCHIVPAQIVQGLFLTFIMGGLLWKVSKRGTKKEIHVM